MARVVATIEARMTSSRLPGKVLKSLGSRPALEWMISRVKQSSLVDEVVVATTTNADDDPIVEFCKKNGTKFFRGSEEDVLSRVLGAAKSEAADIIVELTGDCPFLHSSLIDESIEAYLGEKVDYVANRERTRPGYPIGFDVQVFSSQKLGEIHEITDDPLDRVHVSLYFHRFPHKFSRKFIHPSPASLLFAPDLALTLDEEKDYLLLDQVAKYFEGKGKEDFTPKDIIVFLRERVDIATINVAVKRKKVEER